MTSKLTTDGYKFSMAQAGFPMRPETFYLSFRKGGWQYIPFDLAEWVRGLLPSALVRQDEDTFLADAGYALTPAMRTALTAKVEVRAVPAGTWVHEREPILTITGPAFLVSWLEPLVLRLFFPIQLATEIARKSVTAAMLEVTCSEQAQIARGVLDAMKVEYPIDVSADAYMESVRECATDLIQIVRDPARLFEVGMRAATCEMQHSMVLQTLREAGILSTSNVALAHALGMKAVGTMGHEHIQRWGNDLDAYRSMRDMRNGAPSYLLDTFDTISSGIPAAIKVMQEREHACSIRYDSGDKYAQYLYSHGEFSRNGLEPTHVLEDGLDAGMTAKFEQLRSFTGLAPEKQVYGYGGYFVSRHWRNPLTRDRVAAVYKLTQTSGDPRMKFGNEAGLGKISIPGNPTVWRRLRGSDSLSVIAQVGETVPEDYVDLHSPEAPERLRICNVNTEILRDGTTPYRLSPETQKMVERLRR